VHLSCVSFRTNVFRFEPENKKSIFIELASFKSLHLVKFHVFTLDESSGVASPKFLVGEMFDFRRLALFCSEKRLTKHKMTIFSKHLGGHGPFGRPVYVYG